ncbi:glycosyl hydrolase [Actinomycetospora cinnamomea]|uniref:Chitinase n=1 Tax=Actinomycetospora cinnamomea TaxID=663609 RepID=A0A2U1FQN3_9PSEU|nr:glycosyl hydrolase [Actinomycetospora cinnamomea]PVZ14380.1 chitinase [Actinomycetospora cinnamomea]
MNPYTDPTVRLTLAVPPPGHPTSRPAPPPGRRLPAPAVHPMTAMPPGPRPGPRRPVPAPAAAPRPPAPAGEPGHPPPSAPPPRGGDERPGGRGRRLALLAGGSALVAVLAVVALLLTGVIRTGPSAPPVLSAGPLPTERVTPYADMSTATPPDLAAYVRDTGQRDVVLAFVLAGPDGCDRPAWGGTVPVGDPKVTERVAALRAAGGSVAVATGGARAPYLETACTDAESLARAYRTALDVVGSNHLDVDLEAAVDSDLVADALAALQRERGTAITLTLPVAGRESALTAAGLEILRAVADRGVAVRTNTMAMNFPHTGDWRGAVLGSMDAAARQLGEVWPTADPAELRRRLGVTVMIGRNDQGMVTTPEDAAAVVDRARALGLGSVGLWSVTRDVGSCPTAVEARPDCSGVAQGRYAYTGVLQGFA